MINQEDIPPERLRSFVDQFQTLIGRSERMDACTAYLADLLSADQRCKRSVTSSAVRPHALRQFVNRSPWQDDAVMTRLRELIFTTNPKGVLVLTELHIDKKGRQSVGIDHQITERHPHLRHKWSSANCQTVVMWSWVTDAGAWPVAAQLYLPPRWTMDTTRTKRMALPADAQIYRTKVQIALNLLDQISPQLPVSRVLGVDLAFAEEWALIDGLEQRHEVYLAQINFNAPLFTPSLPNKLSDFSIKLKTVADAISPGHMFKLKMLRQLLISKKRLRQDLLKHIKLDAKPGWSPVPGSPNRYLYWYYNRNDLFGYYLINRADIPRDDMIRMNTAVYTGRKLGTELLDHGGMKRFEGRSWRGFHHHLTLCFMAHYFSHGQAR